MNGKPSRAGVYALILRVQKKTTVEVGRLGRREFASGVYVYVGSAMNSLPGRISRHLRLVKKKHWHIDYLLDGKGVQILGVAWKPTTRGIECRVSRGTHSKALMSVDSFGSGDCNCASHLHYFHRFPEAVWAVSRLGLRFSRTT